MRRAIVIGLAGVAMVMAACGGGSIGDPEGSTNVGGQDAVGLLLEENTDTVTRGQLVTVNGHVSFFAISGTDTMTLRAELNGKTFDVIVDGSVTVDGHDAVLTADETALLQTLAEELRLRLPTATTGASRIEALATLGWYLSQAPTGYVHRRVINGQVLPEGVAASPSNGSVVCYAKGKTLAARYTAPLTATLPTGTKCPVAGMAGTNICTNNGGVPIIPASGSPTQCSITKTVVTGSSWGTSVCNGGNYGCMGLCGGGCSGTKYTVDCLNHDTCSHDAASTTGSADPSCKDEYSAASDDMFGGCTSNLL
jgi:hypothetical protein